MDQRQETKGIISTVTGTRPIPQLLSPTNLKIPIVGETGGHLWVRIKNNSKSVRAKMEFITDADGTFNAAKSVRIHHQS